jgi:hypothetical protein
MKESSSTGPRHRLGLGLNGDLAPRILLVSRRGNVATLAFPSLLWGLRLRKPLVVASASASRLDQEISHVVNLFERLSGSSNHAAQRILGDPIFHAGLMGEPRIESLK